MRSQQTSQIIPISNFQEAIEYLLKETENTPLYDQILTFAARHEEVLQQRSRLSHANSPSNPVNKIIKRELEKFYRQLNRQKMLMNPIAQPIRIARIELELCGCSCDESEFQTCLAKYLEVEPSEIRIVKNHGDRMTVEIPSDAQSRLNEIYEKEKWEYLHNLDPIYSRDGVNVSFQSLNLEGADLSGTDLRSHDLYNMNLTFSQMNDSNLSGVDMEGAVLKNANLENSTLVNANLKRANLENANLKNINGRESRWLVANLKKANLTGANLEDVEMLGVKGAESIFKGATLCGGDLLGANFEEADFSNADLRWANLQEVNFQGANLCGALIKGANLKGADLTGAKAFALQWEDFLEAGANVAHINWV